METSKIRILLSRFFGFISPFASLTMILTLSCSRGQLPVAENTGTGQIIPESYLVYKNFPSKYIPPRNIEVWLPKAYYKLDSLPVLYMFDGQNLFHGQRGWNGGYTPGWQVDEVLDSLISTGTISGIIVVGIFNNGRLRGSEYMPAKPVELIKQRIAESDNDWDKQYKIHPPASDQQLKFIVKELKPFIDANFHTKKDRDNTFIAGSSMGGLISAYAICEYPEVFGGAACLSTHWTALGGVFVEYIKENLPDPKSHKIYFDHGTIGLDSLYEPYQLIVDSAMEEHGYATKINWLTRTYVGANHNEHYWHARFHIPMEFLLSGK